MLPPDSHTTSLRHDILLSLLCALTFTLWNTLGTHRFSIPYLIVTTALTLTSSLTGHLLRRALRLPFDYPTRLLTGFLALNTALYFLLWLLPFGPLIDFLILVTTVIAIHFLTRPAPLLHPSSFTLHPSTLCLLLSLLGATLWSQDSLTPLIRQDDKVILKSWADTPFHVSQISTFAHSHGRRTLQEPRMAGAPEFIGYHYASYTFPALLTAATNTPAFYTFACFWVPAGIFLTGLAAYSLARFWFGPWPAVAATAVLLLTPDAAYQGAGNFFLSYHWLMQVTAASGYGIAVAAVAWLLMFHACQSRRFLLMLPSFLTLSLGLLFKSHMVLPSAPLLWLYPACFMPAIPRPKRIAWIILAGVSFILAVYLSQKSPAIPLLRPDFSAAGDYLISIVRQFDHDGPLKQFFSAHITPSLSSDLTWGFPMLYFLTFGIGGIAYLLLAVGLFRTMPRRILFFPAAVILVYLLMSTSLAYDTREIGRPEELLHRPFPWAYFVLYAWLGGALYRSLYGDAPPPRTPARVAFTCLLLLMTFCTFLAGRNVQSGPTKTWGMSVTSVPHDAGLIDCATYVRNHLPPGRRRPLIQDSANDPLLLVAAFSEAQPYAANCRVTVRPPPGLPERLADVSTLPTLRDGPAIRAYFATHQITWYLLHPDTQTNWPSNLLHHPAYQSQGYRLYHFP